MLNRTSQLTRLALVIGLLSLTATADAQYRFTQGAVTGTKEAARQAIAQRTCAGLTQNRLTAIMLSIPLWEVGGGSATYNPSPMTLSRWDRWATTKNRTLISFATEGDDPNVAGDDRRGHWNPGVGLWQLDTNTSAMALNHADRMDTVVGGVGIARYLRDGFCAGTDTLKSRLRNIWFACQTNDRCYNSYVNGLYTVAGDRLNVTQTAGSATNGGGVLKTVCRFGTGAEFVCSWVDPSLRQGSMDTSSASGVIGGKTPLAAQFLAFNNNNLKYMAWLTTSGLGSEVIRSVSQTLDARDASGVWTRGTNLEVNTCSGAVRCWSQVGM
jgi:hypothetical protein